MSTIKLIAIYIAAHLVPVDVNEFTLNNGYQSITFIKQSSDSWITKETVTNEITIISIKGSFITFGTKNRQDVYDVTHDLSIPINTNWETVSSVDYLDRSLHIQRNVNRAVLSIVSDEVSKELFTVTWKEKKQSNQRVDLTR